ncbi:DNA primase [Formivibrio citricus]|uniref:DNA primase n=1 Tax=Formivibrio citricus TaxID=83765 RepID=A0A1I4VYK8_9NEIS|nr:DNA primase [Formivibrio citricus]SFN06424.1 DNA primase [Formivibrio citricus]
MARIPESFIQDLLNRVDIVEVIERYLPLKKAGQNYAACCPFHKEKSPSFTVSPTKQFYHCFGCGAHGTAIGFVMEYQGVNYPEAIKLLAEAAGMPVPLEVGDVPVEEKTGPRLTDVLKDACDFYRAQLKTAPVAINYLKGRGVSGAIAARFGLGYAPGGEDWQALKQVFPDYDWSKQLPEAGLVIEKEETKRRYDRFRDRVMFPILNQKGLVIGFGGRVMGQGEPKYLNSPETPVFEKGRELYGLPQARAAIRDRGRVLVVEGYMDVVMLHQHGVEYAVATLGTACTPEHVKKLLKLADEVVFCFDGDAAGRRAAWRGLENSLAEVADGKELRFLFLPTEHDPDSFVREFGRERFEALLVQDALPLSQYLLRELSAQIDLTKEEGRARLLHVAQPYLARMAHAPALQMLLKKRLAEICQLTFEEVGLLQSGKGKKSGAGAGKTEREVRQVRPRLVPQARKVRQDSLSRLQELVLFAPELATKGGPVWRDWPSGRGDLVAALLEMAREAPELTGVVLVERWRGEPEYDRLLAMCRHAAQTFEKFSGEELEAEFLSTLTMVGQELGRPATRDRKAELEYRHANGGLTEEEKAEYLALALRK